MPGTSRDIDIRNLILSLVPVLLVLLLNGFDLFQAWMGITPAQEISLTILLITATLWVTELMPLFATSFLILLLQVAWLTPAINSERDAGEALLHEVFSGDLDKVLLAMRSLPYDQLVLVGEAGEDEPEGLEELRRLEALAGKDVLFERVDGSDFIELVDEISSMISRYARTEGRADEVVLNISGGTKIMADAALFAAFRMGAPAYHVTDRVVRLPVIRGVTAKNRFTPLQAQFIAHLGSRSTLAGMCALMTQRNMQSVERVMRELRKMGLVDASLESGLVVVRLTDEGREVRAALVASNGTGCTRP